jgi:hypothetical protein
LIRAFVAEVKATQDIELMQKLFPKSNHIQISELKGTLFPELRVMQVIEFAVVIP